MPHFHVGDKPVLDLLGPDYTLIRFDASIDVSAIQHADAPITVLDAPRPPQAAFRHKLLIVRADTHIAWRGDALPADPAALINRLTGRHAGRHTSQETR